MTARAPTLHAAVHRPRERDRSSVALLWWIGLPALAGALILSATLGAYALSLADLGHLWALWTRPAGSELEPELAGAQVFWHIRAPRILMAALAGSALGLSGALAQGLFRNPLADPGLIGVSAGSALGAATCIVLLPWTGWVSAGFAVGLSGVAITMVAAFVGGLSATALAWTLARRHGRVDVAQLLLVGIAINALAGTALGLLTYLANETQLRALSFWLMGSLSPSQWNSVMAVAPCVLLALLACRAMTAALDAFALGEAQARLMGVDVARMQRQAVVLSAVAVGAVTAVVGMVGFIGLVAPHLVRRLAGPRHRVVLPGSALLGATLVLLADTAARTLFAPTEMPLGVLTGLIGAPTFLWLLKRRTAALPT